MFNNISDKPDIPQDILDKWQRIVNLMAMTAGVPAGLIMKVDPPEIEVFISSKTEKNPYHKGEKANLNTGLYCETVIQKREPLLVPDATKDPEWDHNPNIKLGMIYYNGFPIEWPDGQIFGTICILDYKDNPKASDYKNLIYEFKVYIETDLELILKRYQLDKESQILRESEEKYSDLFNKMINGFALHEILLDKKGNPCNYRFIEINPAFEQMTGLKKDKIIGKTVLEILPKTEKYWIETYGKVALEGGSIKFVNYSNELDKYFEVMAYCPKKGYFATIFNDITDTKIYEKKLLKNISNRKMNEQRIIELNDALKILNKILRHDILNDLTIVLNALDMDDNIDTKIKSRASKAIDKSITLIERIRELERALISGGKLEKTEIDAIVKKIIKNYDEIDFNVHGNCIVLADEALIPLIDNIIRNAVIHGKTGRIDINIKDNDKYCEVLISDYGKGIPDEIKKKIFEEGESFGETRGSGLGLFIAKKVIERYGGTIKVEDNNPSGAVFILRLNKGLWDIIIPSSSL